ncbi:hypothetical protein WMY93_020756 [Mugilogobius chulae]|uniref:Uncharacterized protein n=1 Tax=Mugilogobius chulae TaxID=88201 RepID=A0AAW0ND32_9GOBI
MDEQREEEMEEPEEAQGAGSVQGLDDDDEERRDRIAHTDKDMERWSKDPTLTQALFELVEQHQLQVRASSLRVCMVWLLVGDEEVFAEGATREEASVKAMSLVLERLRKQAKDGGLEETDEEKEEGHEVREETLREQGEESVSVEENSCPGPSAAFGSEEETTIDSVMRSFGRIFVNLFSKEQTVCEEEKENTDP